MVEVCSNTQSARECHIQLFPGVPFPLVERIRSGILLALCCFGIPAAAQYRFDSWTTDNGLPENSVLALRQTRDGYLWMTTSGGLVRFDGVRFRWFTRENTPQLTTNGFAYYALFEDRHGCLWAGTWTGGVVRYCNGEFTSITTKDGLPSNRVVRIDEDDEGTVWIFNDPGLAKWRDGRVTRVAPEPGSPFNPWLKANVLKVGIDAYLFGLWQVEVSGWQRFAFGHWAPLPLPPGGPDKTQHKIMQVVEDSQDSLLYRFWEDPSTYYVLREGHLSIYQHLPPSSYVCYQDRQGFLWAADHDGRITRLKDGRVMPVTGFSTPLLFRALEDREGTLWLGTSKGGLYRATPRVAEAYRVPGSPELNDIETVLEDRAGNIWFGSHGLFRFRNGRFDSFYRAGSLGKLVGPSRTAYPQRWENIVSALYKDRDGTLLVGTWSGAARFDGKQMVSSGAMSQVRDRVDAILRDRAGDLWIGGERGLYRIQGDRVTLFGAQNGLPAIHVHVIRESRTGTLWVGTTNGLARGRNGIFSPWSGPAGLSSANVTALYEDKDGVLWIGTYDTGLYRLEQEKVTHYTSASGLFNDGVFQIIEDDQGFFWFSCHLGIYRIRKQELNDFAAGQVTDITSTHFGKGDGLVNVECSSGGQPTGYLGHDGRLWFPTARGLAVIDTHAVSFNRNPPPVAIEDVTLDGKSLSFRDGVKVLPGKENLEIQYTALSFIKPEQVRFRYRMEGLDPDWVNPRTRRSAYYSRIPPGAYRFRVIAANSDGVWNLEGANLAVSVLPPWYATWQFRTLASLAAAALVWAAWQLRIAGYKRTQALQQAFSRQLIASQENERKRIAAELHDSLGQHLVVIKNLAQIHLQALLKDGRDRAHLEELSSEASLALDEVREISYDLRPYQLDRLGLTKAIEAVINIAAAASETNFATEIENIDDSLPKELEINFYRIVQECLSNIVKHSQAAKAFVSIHRDGRWLRLVVEDDGIGFTTGPTQAKPKEGGFGLLSLSERVQLLAGTSQIRSAPGKGTVLNVDIDTEALRGE